MSRTILIAIAAATAASCAGQGKIAVRALPSPLANGDRSVSFRVAEANGQFALGNVALALESYRKALRENVSSVDAMVGMAACYDAMGRFDLSRRHYEAALAIEPANRDLLNRLSASLLQQGLATEAAAVRQEIAARAHAMSNSVQPSLALPETQSASAGASVTVPLPVARRLDVVTVTLATATDPAVAGRDRHRTGMRLERLSLGEVALVTTEIAPSGPASRLAKNSLGPPQRMLPSLRPSSTPLLLLNAARSQGLAARTRRDLIGHGFGDALLGNAPNIRAATVIIAPVSDRARAQRLASVYGLKARVMIGPRLTMILGRDAVARRIRAG